MGDVSAHVQKILQNGCREMKRRDTVNHKQEM